MILSMRERCKKPVLVVIVVAIFLWRIVPVFAKLGDSVVNAVIPPVSRLDCMPTQEVCDGIDNDCDGITDETDPNDPALCAPIESCVNVYGRITCAQPCMTAGFPCPPGFSCGFGVSTETGMTIGDFCIENLCGDCTKQTLLEPDGSIHCAPKDTLPDANCAVPPVCVCKNYTSCRSPCDGVVCDAGKVCTNYGNNAGYCVTNACPDVPCAGCNMVCYNGTCVTNPCLPNTCPGQTCIPSTDFSTFTCVEPCANPPCGVGGSGVGGNGGGGGGVEATGSGGSVIDSGGCACEFGTTRQSTVWRWVLSAFVVQALRRRSRNAKSLADKIKKPKCRR